ncbi:MAG: TetR/AcrR family transcriptional regulator, partial [Sneathiella sp.]
AAEIGVTHGALYNHFINKDALLSALAAIGYHELATLLSEAETAEQHMRLYATFALKHRHAYANMMTRSHEQFKTVPELQAGADAVINVSLALLAPRQGSETEKRRAVMRHWMLVHGGVSLHIAGTLQGRSDDAFIAELLAIGGLQSSSEEITP